MSFYQYHDALQTLPIKVIKRIPPGTVIMDKVNRILKFAGCLGGEAILSEVTLNGATISRESRVATALFKYAACHHR